MDNSYIFTEPHTSNLAKLRIKAREKRRITYDCLNAIVEGDKVKCRKGNVIGRAQNGTASLLSVLSGRSAKVCQECKEYDADEVTTKITGGKVYD
jgi:hypothetical protein